MERAYSFSPMKKRDILGIFSITSSLIFLNVVLYLVLAFFPQDFVLKNIAISLENIQQLRIWTFITSMFMHGSFFHLFANMMSLLFLGTFVERIIGRKRFFWFYLISGLFGGAMYILTELFFP